MNAMTPQHTLLLFCLNAHRGKAYAIKSKDLLKDYNSRTFEHISSRTLRSLKIEINTLFGGFICSCGEGYYLANTEQDLIDLELYLYSWIKNMAHETKMIKENYHKATTGKQLNLI